MAEMVLPPAPPNMTYKVEKLNPLAFPKGMDLRCELTGKPALVPQHVEAPTLTTAQESHGPRERHWRGSGAAPGSRGRTRRQESRRKARHDASLPDRRRPLPWVTSAAVGSIGRPVGTFSGDVA